MLNYHSPALRWVLHLHIDLYPLRHEKSQRLALLRAYFVDFSDFLAQPLFEKRRVFLDRLFIVYFQQGNPKQQAADYNRHLIPKSPLWKSQRLRQLCEDKDKQQYDKNSHHQEERVVHLQHPHKRVMVLSILVAEQNGIEFAHVE